MAQTSQDLLRQTLRMRSFHKDSLESVFQIPTELQRRIQAYKYGICEKMRRAGRLISARHHEHSNRSPIVQVPRDSTAIDDIPRQIGSSGLTLGHIIRSDAITSI